SPAQKAGLENGDLIVSVEGESIAGESSEVSTGKIKGPEGTEVTSGVKSSPGGEVDEMRIERAQISLPNVTSRVEKVGDRTLGYVSMLSFSEGVHAQLREAVQKVE